ncbi:hypothetical protein ScalyP_jg7608 [Parmales sp. scaly parma]|nr:hypothetical protein ScalyP_jg7608 [Parmales sp. scaly parma]
MQSHIKTASGEVSSWTQKLNAKMESQEDIAMLRKNLLKQEKVIPPPSSPYQHTPLFFTEQSMPELSIADRQFFLACQKLKGGVASSPAKLSELIKDESNPDNAANINAKFFSNSLTTSWDVMLVPSSNNSNSSTTKFAWPSPSGQAFYGDTILHIAIKEKDTPLLRWLAEQNELDLNAVNGQGMTASQVADNMGMQPMYDYFFVLS